MLKINKTSLQDVPVKTTPENVKEANEALFRAKNDSPCCCQTLWYDAERNENDLPRILEISQT